jgi:hypothetical protein
MAVVSARRRHDFDPLVDQHACERLREIQGRFRMHDERNFAAGISRAGSPGKPIQRSPSMCGKLRYR